MLAPVESMAGLKKNMGLFRKISWIAMGVCATGVLLGSVYLAFKAQSSDPVQSVSEKSASAAQSKRRYKPPSSMRAAFKPTKLPSVRSTPKSGSTKADLRTKPIGAGTSALARPPLPNLRPAARANLANNRRPSRLSKDELSKRREERRSRQSERLRTRITTLEDRIAKYRQDGTRTEAQISRMQRSLERMVKRLKRMKEEKGQ